MKAGIFIEKIVLITATLQDFKKKPATCSVCKGSTVLLRQHSHTVFVNFLVNTRVALPNETAETYEWYATPQQEISTHLSNSYKMEKHCSN